MKTRIFFDLLFLATIFYAPWWLIVLLALALSFFFNPYYEVIVAGVFIDILYGSSAFPFGGISGLLGAVVVFFASMYAKKIVR